MFQSTRPRGARLEHLYILHDKDVSIHAPAWGATRTWSFSIYRSCFNPRARVGRDSCSIRLSISLKFQSTRPRGARLIFLVKNQRCCRFNPRARVGRDVFPAQPLCRHLFQSTRPRGARRAVKLPDSGRVVSIHAPAWGATLSGADAMA